MNLVAACSRNSEVLNRILLRNLDLTQTVFTRSVEHVNHNKNNFKFIRSIVFYWKLHCSTQKKPLNSVEKYRQTESVNYDFRGCSEKMWLAKENNFLKSEILIGKSSSILLKSTSVKKGCTKSKKTPKFGVKAPANQG